ncbi:MAG: hypothetical protein A3K19_28985 [Lentisphaerae bacterium RIFOXYB12_FULL_65_16]|nr:MAG: hypothetical protein A3K18_25570 [Lentisphaerae bacterium RIFOXYA12_64_32]OGV88327.1 MAG: hypothetical protein A3K19_28985 [Lentisphaerae bacterium RIFOXYB12_FULL_65_16]
MNKTHMTWIVSLVLMAGVATFLLRPICANSQAASEAPPAAGKQQEGWLDDYEKAQANAKETGRPILVNFSGSDWCGWCIKLDKEVFAQAEFKTYAKDNLVLFNADFPRRTKLSEKVTRQNEKLAEELGVEGFPTVLLVEGDGAVIARTGYQPGGAKAYIEHLMSLLARRQKRVTSAAAAPPQDQAAERHSAPKVGAPAPEFTLQDFDGRTFTLSELTKTKGVLLWFTNLCGGCQAEIPVLLRLRSLYATKGIDIVAVSVLAEDRETVAAVIRKNKVTFPFLYDPKGAVTELYSGQYVPATCPLKNIYLIQKGGKIVWLSHLPGSDEKEVASQLDEITKEAGQ